MPYPFQPGETLTAAALNDALAARMDGSGTTLSLPPGAVVFGSGVGGFDTDASNFVYDSSTHRFGIRTDAPQATLQIGQTAATVRAYNQYTNSTNGEWSYLGDWGKTTNVATYGTDKNGSGATRNIQFLVGGSNKLDYGITTASSWTAADSFKLNSNAATIFIHDSRSLGVGNGGALALQHASVTYGSLNAYAVSGTTGVEQGDLVFKTMRSGTLTEAGRFTADGALTFGGTTTSFPALRANGSVLEVKLGDNSVYTSLATASQKIVTNVGATDGAVLNVDSSLNGTSSKFGEAVPVYMMSIPEFAGTPLYADDGLTPLTADDGVTPLYADDAGGLGAAPTVGFNVYKSSGNFLFGKGSFSGTNYAGSHQFASALGAHFLTASTATGAESAIATMQNILCVSRTGMVALGPGVILSGAYPALKRNGVALEVRLADDSDYSDLTTGNHTVGPGTANALGATGPFLYITACAGIPTGIPSLSSVGYIPIQFDTTNKKLYVYDPITSTWKSVTLT